MTDAVNAGTSRPPDASTLIVAPSANAGLGTGAECRYLTPRLTFDSTSVTGCSVPVIVIVPAESPSFTTRFRKLHGPSLATRGPHSGSLVKTASALEPVVSRSVMRETETL